MSTIITRSALIFHGHDPAPDVHSIVIDRRGRRVVTWADVMDARREKQRAILERKRAVVRERAYRLWVAYFDQDLFGGWHAFLDDFRGSPYGRWIDRYRIVPSWCMRVYPLVLPLGSCERERWEDWKVAFAHAHRRGTHHGKPRGCAYVWWDGRGEPRPIPPSPHRRGRSS